MKLQERLKRRIKRARSIADMFAILGIQAFISIGMAMGIHSTKAFVVSLAVAIVAVTGLTIADKHLRFYQRCLANTREREIRRETKGLFLDLKEAA